MPAVLEAVEPKVIQPFDLDWNPHPKFPGVELAYMLTRKEDGVDMTCAIVHWKVGAEIPRHIHEESDDILYILKGKAKIWIDGSGDIPLEAGSFVRVPAGVEHQPHDIEEDLLAHDTWFPATV
jgi:mannose-6-phosphate isomerase-like protein (cupin superfamily)